MSLPNHTTSLGTQCRKCLTTYHCYGFTPTYYYVNGMGPICEMCIKKGVPAQGPLREPCPSETRTTGVSPSPW